MPAKCRDRQQDQGGDAQARRRDRERPSATERKARKNRGRAHGQLRSAEQRVGTGEREAFG